VDTLIERSISRKNPPREMNSRNRSENENYIKRAISNFDRIVENKKIQSRLLIVDNSIFYEQKRNTLLDNITNFIIDFETRQN
jgi:hypothetical protein